MRNTSHIITLFLGLLMLTSANAGGDKKDPTRFDFAPDFPDSVIKARIATIKSDIPITYNDKVRSFIDYFSIRHRDYTRKMLQRQKAYFPIFEAYLKEHNMPEALKYLTIVESGINPKAKSRAGAMGLWQFMPSTGKLYQLHYDYYIDDKMDPYKATEAACKFLANLYSMFNDWELALAAYNCGPGNVRKAIRRSGYKKTFWEIYRYLPRETRGYVPQFHAVNYLMRYAPEHNLFPAHEEFMMETDSMIVNQYFNIEAFCEESGICLSTMEYLNPSVKRNVIPAHKKNFVLRVPADKMDHIEANKVALLDSAKKKGKEALNYQPKWAASSGTAGKEKTYYRVRSGDYLGKIAQRYHVRISDLRAWNHIGHNNMIRVGQRLVVYMKPSKYSAPAKTTKTAVATTKPITLPKGKTYTVQPGDTLWSISKKFDGLTIEQIKRLNNLSGSGIKPGQQLKLS